MRRRRSPWPVAGLVLAGAALTGCPDPGPEPSPPDPPPSPRVSAGDEPTAAPDTGGDLDPEPAPDPGGQPPVPVDGVLFGGDAGVLPSPSSEVERLLQPPAVAVVRSAGSCSGLAEADPGWSVECDTVTTSTGDVLAWVVESPEGPGVPGVRAGVWRERPDGEWAQVLTTGDDPPEDHTGGQATPVVLPDGSEQVLMVLYGGGTGRREHAAVVGEAGTVLAAFTAYQGSVRVDGSALEVSYPVSRPGDGDAAPSGGLAEAEVRWVDGEWVMTDVAVSPMS